MLSLDISKVEQGLGIGTIRTIKNQDPFASPIVRQTGFSADPNNPTALAITDGGVDETEFDVSQATYLRLYYDVLIAGGTFLDLYVFPLAANLGGGGVPELKSPVFRFQPRGLVLSSSDGPLKTAARRIRWIATEAISSVSIPRPSGSVALGLAVVSDSALNGLALAIQTGIGKEGD